MKILEHNVETGEIVEREATAEEVAFVKASAAESKAELEAKAILQAKKQEVLEKLGLTSDEVAALLA